MRETENLRRCHFLKVESPMILQGGVDSKSETISTTDIRADYHSAVRALFQKDKPNECSVSGQATLRIALRQWSRTRNKNCPTRQYLQG